MPRKQLLSRSMLKTKIPAKEKVLPHMKCLQFLPSDKREYIDVWFAGRRLLQSAIACCMLRSFFKMLDFGLFSLVQLS